MVGRVRPLLDIACLSAFWSLPVSYLLQVCELCDWHPPTTTLAAVLKTMCENIFKDQCADGLIVQVLRQRFVSFDHDIGVDDLVHMDW
eukprot:3895804-Pyramimonas_sp.AAC.1